MIETKFAGIHPHLNSALQQTGGKWRSFHSEYLMTLRLHLDQILPPNYYAIPEDSLQVGKYDLQETTLLDNSRSVADMTVYRVGNIPTATTGSALAELTATLEISLADTTLDVEEMTAISIYRVKADSSDAELVTRIELLSPANKLPGSHYKTYHLKREETLRSGICLIELDYLHEQAPILHKLPSYPDQDPHAYPYYVIVNIPRPSFAQGKAYVFGISVRDPLPKIRVPLAIEDEPIRLDLGAVYRTTWQQSRFLQSLMNETTDPIHIERYHPQDQAWIRQQLTV